MIELRNTSEERPPVARGLAALPHARALGLNTLSGFPRCNCCLPGDGKKQTIALVHCHRQVGQSRQPCLPSQSSALLIARVKIRLEPALRMSSGDLSTGAHQRIQSSEHLHGAAVLSPLCGRGNGRPRKAEVLPRCHRAGKCQSWDLNPGHLPPVPARQAACRARHQPSSGRLPQGLTCVSEESRFTLGLFLKETLM